MSNRTDILYVTDIRESVEAIFQYTSGISFEAFSHDRMCYSAVIREFEIIGEAVGKLSDTLKNGYPLVNWQDIKDFRNILIHEYFGIDLEIVWNVVCEDLPKLYESIKAMESQANMTP
jgi:uncharacterized protein with HEPN domain